MKSDIIKILGIGFSATILAAGACCFLDYRCSILCLLLGIVLIILFIYNTKKRYDNLNELNDYLTLICSGNYNLDINDNTEGELSILKNNLYKVITILQTQKDKLAKDRTFLADNLADISHQLRTPLTSVMMLIELVKTEPDEAKRLEFIEVIESQLDKTKWLISNLLKLSKLDAGTVQFSTEKINMLSLLNDSVKPFLVTMELKNIEFINHAGNVEIEADRKWTTEAVMNIIKNCIEHTGKDGRISITSEHTNLFDSMIIKDNGTGIAKEDMPHIFERFYHGKNASGESVGIGLALAKEILAKQNASISVSSTEGEGTRFDIRFYKAII